MPRQPTLAPLPIDDVLADVTRSLATTPNLVLKAPTGAGKTMRVAPALLGVEAVGGRVLLLEPRRMAARAAARRIAMERGAALGDEVGYHVRFDRRAGDGTRLVAMTNGIFLRRLQEDPFLDGVGAVVFDEFHERSLDVDLALAMVRRIQRDVRPELRIVVMSATLETGPVAAFLGDAPVFESRGRSFPVEIRHRDPDPALRGFDARGVAAATREAAGATEGDVLVFLPGLAEIRRVRDALSDFASRAGMDLRDLYGDLPAEEQDAVLTRGERRRIVLATNVAESSVTLEGVTAVVDSGLARVMRLDPAVGMDRLEVTRISRASAEQRAGRAGRTAPGLCFRLWNAHEDAALRPVEEPEVRRTDLARAVLELRNWGEKDPRGFDWFEAPSPAALDAAEALLDDLGATSGGSLTGTGRELAALPLPPRVGRLLLEGRRLGVARRAALAAAVLSERDVMRRDHRVAPASAHESDVLERVLLLGRFAEARSRGAGQWPELHVGAAHGTLRVARELERAAGAKGEVLEKGREAVEKRRGARGGSRAAGQETGTTADADDALLRALVAAFPDRVAMRRGGAADSAGRSDRARMTGGRGLRLADSSVVVTAPLFLALSVDAGRRGERAESLVRLASAIEEEWLPAGAIREGIDVEFDAGARRVVAVSRRRYRDLVLGEKPARLPRERAGGILADEAARQPGLALDLDDGETAAWLARVRSLAAWMPDLALPDFGQAELAGVARDVAAGRVSFEEMRRAPLLDFLRARLDHSQQRALDRHAPEKIRVPSGSSIRLGYEPGRPPVLAARIQEMFGMAETPRVAGGRVPVTVHLLAPNQRPAQVTEDLASFWKNTYADVRRELRARYPRHSWPEDPLTAEARRRPARRKR